MPSHDQTVQQQFDPQAEAYLASPVHAAGPDLTAALNRVRAGLPGTAQALDVGCGAGHLSFTLAPALQCVIALDPSPGMLATVTQAAARNGLTGLGTQLGSAAALPFAAERFDLVCTRYSAHHWLDVEAGLAQMRRVLRPGGRLLLIDITAPASALVDTHLQAMELLRDASHVRNRSIREWMNLLQAAGFNPIEQESWATRLEFTPWVQRMRTPADRIAAIRQLQAQAPTEVRQELLFETDGSFTAQTTLFWAAAA